MAAPKDQARRPAILGGGARSKGGDAFAGAKSAWQSGQKTEIVQFFVN